MTSLKERMRKMKTSDAKPTAKVHAAIAICAPTE